uniref:Na_Ca_ex domain-containing protein n=1 Tax=Steinernema glaseri TaxID=37863 RepID=A0A1I8ASN4_9BILA
VILAIMMSNEASPTLVRDTIYSAVMLDINGILGLAALMGGLKHGEQSYNDDSARTYSVMIMTAMGVSMVVPEFIPEAQWHLYSYPQKKRRDPVAGTPGGHKARSIAILISGVVVIGLLAEVMSKTLDYGLEGSGAPPVLTAIVVAAISAAPEILTALRAALANRMQSVVNIALGASLSTVILTVPLMEAMALYTGQPFQMAMTPVQTVMIFITLIVSAINLNDGETNAIEGMTHFPFDLAIDHSPPAADHHPVGPVGTAQQQGRERIMAAGKTQFIQLEQGQIGLLAHGQLADVVAPQQLRRTSCGPAQHALGGDGLGTVAQALQGDLDLRARVTLVVTVDKSLAVGQDHLALLHRLLRWQATIGFTQAHGTA